MKKSFLLIGTLALAGCGGSDDTESAQAQPVDHGLYTSSFNDADELIFRKYGISAEGQLTVQYLKGSPSIASATGKYLTQYGVSERLPPVLSENHYLLGEKATFDGDRLTYDISNGVSGNPLMLSAQYKKTDVSGRKISDDGLSPFYGMDKTPTGQILLAVLGLNLENERFPAGSVCWQKISVSNNQDYIEFYPALDYSEQFKDTAVETTGNWSGVAWTRYQPDLKVPRIDVRLTMDGVDYWGKYHHQNELIEHSRYYDENEQIWREADLYCDFMNSTAFQKVTGPLTKIGSHAKGL